MEQAIELMVAISLFIVGLSYIFNPKDWMEWLKKIQKDGKASSLKIGSLNLLLGTFITAFHWVWEGVSIIVTLIGVIGIFKGIIYLMFPGWLPHKLSFFVKQESEMMTLIGLITVVIAIFIFYSWCGGDCLV